MSSENNFDEHPYILITQCNKKFSTITLKEKSDDWEDFLDDTLEYSKSLKAWVLNNNEIKYFIYLVKNVSKNKFKKLYLSLKILEVGASKKEFERRLGFISNNKIAYAKSRIDLPLFLYNLKGNFKYNVLDSISSSDIVIRCCNDFPLDYYFKDNILFGYKIDETILKDSYNRYTNYIDSLKIQQQKRKTIIKSKR